MTEIELTKKAPVVFIGKQGENLATEVAFNIAPFIEEFGAGAVQLLHQRSCDDVPYIVIDISRRDDKKVIWRLTDDDTACAGYGRGQLNYYVGDVLAKSFVFATHCAESLTEESAVPAQKKSDIALLTEKVEKKQDKLEAGEGIEIDGNVISATGGTVDAYTKEETDALLADKQDKGDYATETELGEEETARQEEDASLLSLINTKAQQRRTLYTPTAAAVVASNIADGVYEATAAFILIINPNAAEPETVAVNVGDLFYVKTESVAPYCRGFVLGDDMTIFTYPDSDEGVTLARITGFISEFLGISAALDSKADASALADYVTTAAMNAALAAKQNALISGINIKTLNGQSFLGSGNIAIEANERELFVDALPSTDIEQNTAYYILNSKLFPDASGLVTATYPCVLVTQVGNEWKLMATNSSTNFYAYTGTSPKSKTYQLYKVQDGEWVANGDATTGTGWATAMGIPAKNNVSAIKFANMNLKGESGLQTNYNITNNVADIYGVPVDASQINPYGWLKYKYNGTAWELIGECDFEELFDKVNAKVLADYPTTSAMNTALATKADKVAYSTTEKVIGTWLDGKPLYEKTAQCTAPANLTLIGPQWIETFDTTSIDNIVYIEGWFTHNSIKYPINSNIVIGDNSNGQRAYNVVIEHDPDVNEDYLSLAANRDATGDVGVITIRYTKNTDTAN